MTGNRISWYPAVPGVTYGNVGGAGTIGNSGIACFKITGYATARLNSYLPGHQSREHEGDPDELKRLAEEWLAEFVSSLGAVFPADERRRCAGIIRRAAVHLAGDDPQMRAYRESAMTMADLIGAPRCGECSGVHPANPGSDGDSCAGHGHLFVPRDHPDGLDPEYQTWWGCPECGNGRWFS